MRKIWNAQKWPDHTGSPQPHRREKQPHKIHYTFDFFFSFSSLLPFLLSMLSFALLSHSFLPDLLPIPPPLPRPYTFSLAGK